jgi:hypothetical protein
MSPGAFATFDGTGGLQIANGNEPSNIDAQDFAVSFWIRLPDASKPCYRCPIVGQRFGCDDETHWDMWFFEATFYTIRFEMRNTVMPTGFQALDVDVDAILKDTQWHFIVAFREGTTLNFAVDGRVVGERSFASVANLARPRRPLAIGYWNESCGGKDFFSGQLADVRLFVRKLPLCNATATTSASQTSVASTQTAAPTSVATQTPVIGTTTTQTTASTTGATNTTQQTTTAASAATAQVSPTPTEPDSQIGAIVGGVVAALVLVAIVVGVFLFQRRRRGDNANTRSETGSVTAQSQSATSSPYGSTLAVLN